MSKKLLDQARKSVKVYFGQKLKRNLQSGQFRKAVNVVQYDAHLNTSFSILGPFFRFVLGEIFRISLI